ncbi:S8/S53 family peptidase [Photobacterium sp. Hal280]|uniref:S8/S53 family peptidase n=1 Tax=Photobacterium sp. Hal280 TaxID=3035163 RepID=UPI00301D7461
MVCVMRFIMMFCVLLSGRVAAGTDWPASITMMYQGQPLALTLSSLRQGEPVYTHSALANKGLKLGQRVLFRHRKSLDLDRVTALSGRRFARVFELDKACWSVVLTQSASESLALIEQLRRTGGITLAEPDLLQVRLYRDSGNSPVSRAPAAAVRQRLSLTTWPEHAGRGVKIAVIDSAFSLSDSKLESMSVEMHYDIDHRQALPMKPDPVLLESDTLHGDASLATIWSRHPDYPGLAPDASAILLRRDKNWTSDILMSLQLAYLTEADLVQAAWTLPFTQQALTEALDYLSDHGRQGKGTVIVAAAGNHAEYLDHGFSLAAQPQVLTVNAVSQTVKWPVTGSHIASYVEVPYQVYVRATGKYSLVFSNSSAATAAMTGVLAAVLSVQPSLSARQLGQLVRQYSQPALNAQSMMQHVQNNRMTH